MTLHIQDNNLLILAIVLISGIFFGKLAYKMKLPGITGHIFAGVLIGPYVLKIFSFESLHHFDTITTFALGLISVTAGSHLSYQKVHNAMRRMMSLIIIEVIFTVTFIFVPLFFIFKLNFPVCLILSSIAIATSPATVIHSIKENKAKGIFVKTLVLEVALNNVFCIIIFEIFHTVSAELLEHSMREFHYLTIAVTTLLKLVTSIGLGAAIGFLLIYLTKNVRFRTGFFSFCLISILLTVGLEKMFSLSPLFACLVLGIVIGNFSPKQVKILESFDDLEYSLYAAFFTIAGAHLNFATILSAGLITGVYVITRAAAKIVTPLCASLFAHSPKKITFWLGPGLLPQAGMAVGLILLLQDEVIFKPYFSLISTIILTAVLINELIGPVVTKMSLIKSNEVNKDRLRLIEFLHEEYIIINSTITDKNEALDKLIDLLITTHRIDKSEKQALMETIYKREEVVSTNIGGGIAIPHGRVTIDDDIIGVVGIFKKGLDYVSPISDEPVKIVVLMVTPENDYDRHLKVLSAIAKIFGKTPYLKQKLLRARSASEVYELITEKDLDEHNYFID